MNSQSQLTKFESSVLLAIKKIPKGKVATYKAVAKALGKPKAARAVGNALNKNPFAPKVPCHRVITSAGYLGGYALGKNKKIKILSSEGVLFDRRGKIIDNKNILIKI